MGPNVFPPQHYTMDKDGLVCELRRPVEKKGQQEFCVDQKAFAECKFRMYICVTYNLNAH